MGNCKSKNVKPKNQHDTADTLGMGDPAHSNDLHMVVSGATEPTQKRSEQPTQQRSKQPTQQETARKPAVAQSDNAEGEGHNSKNGTSVEASPEATSPKKSRRKGVEIHDSFSLDEVAAPPSSAVKWKLVSVYDGDTITVADPNDKKQRPDWVKFRLLGIDTPEIKDQETFAHEARRRLMVLLMGEEAGGKYFNLVEQNSIKEEGEKGKLKVVKVQGTVDVYIVEATNEAQDAAQDRYGRHIGTLYATTDSSGKFRNLNATMIKEGLATFYEPVGSSMPQETRALFLRCQQEARRNRLFVWENVDETMEVVRTVNGMAFHTSDCKFVANARLQKLTLSEALDEGLSSCRNCHPL